RELVYHRARQPHRVTGNLCVRACVWQYLGQWQPHSAGKREVQTMAMVTTNNPQTTSSAGGSEKYPAALAMVTVLFFFWGFVTVLNDILVPHFKLIFDLSYTKVMLIQFAFFFAYFIFSIP